MDANEVLPGDAEDPAPIDWPARFRRAAEVANERDLYAAERALRHLAGSADPLPDDFAAIGRALLGEE